MKYWNEEIETMDRKALERLQLQRLQVSVSRAATSPFYREVFQRAGLTPEEITTLPDLQKFPFTTKEDLRRAYPDGMLAVERGQTVRLHASSGTTGQVTVIYHTAADLDNWTNTIARSLVMGGCTPDDIFQNMMSYGLFTGGLGLHYGAERLGMLVIPIGGGNTHRQIQFFHDFGTSVIHITPSYALHVADVIEEIGKGPEDFKLRILIFGGEPYSEATRTKIEELFQVKAVNCYGLSEIDGPGVAFECRRSEGMHVWEDNYLVEVIDPQTGEPLPCGETGEVVFTNLNREAMPLIRYRTRDLAYLYRDTDCPCGRKFRRLSRIVGRTDDMLIVEGVNFFPSQIEEALLQIEGIEPHYLIILNREAGVDIMEIQVEVPEELPFMDDLGKLQRFKTTVQDKLNIALGIKVKVTLVEPKTIGRSTGGRMNRVIDKREL